MPQLRHYNPKVAEALVRLSRASARQVELLDWALEPISKMLDLSASGGLAVWGDALRDGVAIRIKANIMDSIPYALQAHLVRRAVTYLLGDSEGISEAHLNAIIETIKGRAGTTSHLPRGITVTKEYGVAVLSLDAEADKFLPPLEGEYKVSIPGETNLPGWIVHTEILPAAALKGGPNQKAQQRADSNEIWSDRWRAALDYERVSEYLMVQQHRPPTSRGGTSDYGPVADYLVLRGRRPGDRFYPYGMESSKKLQDFMVDAHIPRDMRGRVPIFAAGDKIVWIAGWRTDDRVKVTPNTKRTLVIEMKRESGT